MAEPRSRASALRALIAGTADAGGWQTDASRSAVQIVPATVSGSAWRIDQHAALGIVARDLAIGLAQALVEAEVLALEPIRRAAAAPRGGALQADLDRHIEDDGQVRLEIADRDPLHRVDQPIGERVPRLP